VCAFKQMMSRSGTRNQRRGPNVLPGVRPTPIRSINLHERRCWWRALGIGFRLPAPFFDVCGIFIRRGLLLSFTLISGPRNVKYRLHHPLIDIELRACHTLTLTVCVCV
jgi:hypothetical protein